MVWEVVRGGGGGGGGGGGDTEHFLALSWLLHPPHRQWASGTPAEQRKPMFPIPKAHKCSS